MHLRCATLLLGPGDLTDLLACDHLVELERQAARGDLDRPRRVDPDGEVRRRRAAEHEQAEMARLEGAGLTVVRIEPAGASAGWDAAEAATVDAMRTGADVVHQPAFRHGRWRGQEGFLRRVEAPSALGSWAYEPGAVALAHRVKPAAVLRRCWLAEQVARVQGAWPTDVVTVLGDGTPARYPVAGAAAYFRALKARLEARVDGPPAGTYPDPVAHCAICPWLPRCDARRRADDHLSLVAGVYGDTTALLAAAGITTGADLAASPSGTPVPGLRDEHLDRLRDQASLQLEQRRDGVVRHRLLEPEGPGRGLAALPPPSPGDLFFDMEGHPWVTPGGLEYLFGAVAIDAGRPEFHGFWAHSRAEEKQAFEAFVDFVVERRQRYPDLHVYHYAAYEPAALARLARRHLTRRAEVDRLVRGGVLVDLYRVVRQAVLVSQEGYGLKRLEPLYMATREGAVVDGASSIAVYEQWAETRDRRLLDDLRAYNELDCLSTLGLRDWLEARRQEVAARTGQPVPRPEPAGPESTAAGDATAALAAALTDGVPDDPAGRDDADRARARLAQLVSEPDPAGGEAVAAALRDVAGWVADHGVDASGPYRAARDLLLRRPPRRRRGSGPLLAAGEAPAAAARRAAADLDGGCLPVQGGPGAGTTHTAAAIAVDAVGRGRRVGLTAPSPRAVTELVDAVRRRAGDDIEALTGAPANLAGGLAGALDLVVVDEAGGLSLAEAVAVAGAATDVVLLGDPRQVPAGAGGTPAGRVAALDHVLGGAATMPPERGLFLGRTRRLHPDICRFASEVFYDGRLEPDPSSGRQAVAPGPGLAGAGLRWFPVDHAGNRTQSPEEAAVVAGLVDALVGRAFTDAEGRPGRLTLDDILVVTPHDDQVATLAAALPGGARVGAAGRFPGQEAPVVVCSLASSSVDDLPRGVERVLGGNRLSAAVSRAAAVVAIVASPRMLGSRCHSVEQLRAVNALCRFVELAGG